MDRSEERNELSCIDGLKGIASIVILIYHVCHFAYYFAGNPYPFDRLLNIIYVYGYIAVELFFVISGFLAERSYQANTPVSILTHIGKKTRHLYPLMLFTVVLTGILEICIYINFGEFASHPVSLMGFFLYIVGLQNTGLEPLTFNGPAWYIGVLLVMDVIFYGLRKRKNAKLYFVAIMLIGMFIIYGNFYYPFFNFTCARGMVSFFAGVFIFEYIEKARTKATVLCSVVFVICTAMIIWLGTPIVGQLNMFFGTVYFPLLLILVLKVPLMRKFWGNPLFVFLGKISYEIFLYQFPVIITMVLIYRLGIFETFYLYTPEAFALYVISTILIAVISHYALRDKIQKVYDWILKCIFDGFCIS